MKKLSTIFIVAVAAVLLAAGSVMAITNTLFDITGYAGTDIYTDTGMEAAELVDTDGINDDATAFLFFEMAGFANSNTFGIYGYDTDGFGNILLGNTLEVFKGSDIPITSETLQFDISTGDVTVDSSTVNIGTKFGFYLTTPEDNGYTYYSHTDLNVDNFDHLMLFDTSDNSVGSLFGSDIVLAWEDLNGGGDEDFIDMVVGISDVRPVPEPATIFLIGSGLIGLGVTIRRKKLFKK